MRLYLTLSPNSQLVPYAYQRFLVGAFHKWMGENVLHDDLSLYSLSWLTGGKATGGGLNFRNGTTWFISSSDEQIIKHTLQGITSDPEVAFGMRVKEAMIRETEDFGTEHRFLVNSPILVKTRVDDEQKHLSYEDVASDLVLTNLLKSKLTKAGIDSQGVNVQFDRSYVHAKQKLVLYRGIGNKANICPVIVTGSREQVTFAWKVGLGHSTGIGFGALN